MTTTAELHVLCPRCDAPGAFHCSQVGCTWLRCGPCSRALSGQFGGNWDVIWDTVTGLRASLPKVSATR